MAMPLAGTRFNMPHLFWPFKVVGLPCHSWQWTTQYDAMMSEGFRFRWPQSQVYFPSCISTDGKPMISKWLCSPFPGGPLCCLLWAHPTPLCNPVIVVCSLGLVPLTTEVPTQPDPTLRVT